eukprot:10143379-Lingulodinium_polyedra.AAC.1
MSKDAWRAAAARGTGRSDDEPLLTPRSVVDAWLVNSFSSARAHGLSALLLLAVAACAVLLSVAPDKILASRATLTSPASLAAVRSSESRAVLNGTSSQSSRSSWDAAWSFSAFSGMGCTLAGCASLVEAELVVVP